MMFLAVRQTNKRTNEQTNERATESKDRLMMNKETIEGEMKAKQIEEGEGEERHFQLRS